MFQTLDLFLFSYLHDFAGRSEPGDEIIVALANFFPYVCGVFLFLFVFSSIHKEIHVGVESQVRKTMGARMLVAAAISVTVAYAFALLIQEFVARDRPYDILLIDPLFTVSAFSFPSGHAAFLFALAGAVYWFRKRFGALLIFLAFIVSIARIVAGVHYPSDIVGGAILGFFVGSATAFLLRSRSS